MATAFEFISFFIVISNTTPSTCFAIGSSFWANAFFTEIWQNVNDLNALNNNLDQRDLNEIKNRFNGIVQDFSDVKQFSFVAESYTFQNY